MYFVQPCDELAVCAIPGPLSIPGLERRACEDATANVNGHGDSADNVTAVPACTDCPLAGVIESSTLTDVACIAVKQTRADEGGLTA